MSEAFTDAKTEALARVENLERQLGGDVPEAQHKILSDQLDQAFKDAEAEGASDFEIINVQYKVKDPEERQKHFGNLIEERALTLDELVILRDKFGLEG